MSVWITLLMGFLSGCFVLTGVELLISVQIVSGCFSIGLGIFFLGVVPFILHK